MKSFVVGQMSLQPATLFTWLLFYLVFHFAVDGLGACAQQSIHPSASAFTSLTLSCFIHEQIH
jgi:hypothetical protein